MVAHAAVPSPASKRSTRGDSSARRISAAAPPTALATASGLSIIQASSAHGNPARAAGWAQ